MTIQLDDNKYIKLLNEIEKVKKEADELMMKKIDHYEKELALVREDAQIEHLRLTKKYAELLAINEDHQKLNGELQTKLSKYEDKAAHYRRKAVL